MAWTQDYDPFGLWPLSTLVSALPVLTLFFVLLVLKKRVWVSALAGLLVMLYAYVLPGIVPPV
jgi:asparagine N-glycosylation enzyme membrane subunit Stt3